MSKSTCEAAYIAENFSESWNFPKCLGSIDGKHIQTAAPEHSGSIFFNYEGFFSIVLLQWQTLTTVLYMRMLDATDGFLMAEFLP
jgi:hypothetical protein